MENYSLKKQQLNKYDQIYVTNINHSLGFVRFECIQWNENK